MPDPDLILGELNGPTKDWPVNDEEREDWLREVPEYQTILFNFLKEVLSKDEFRAKSGRDLLSSYVPECLEAYVILAYVNGYDSWKEECERQAGILPPVDTVTTREAVMGGREDGASSSSVSAVSYVTAGKRFTSKGRGSGKYKGWSDEGIELYNKLVEIIEKQRKDTTDDRLKDFERKLKERFNTAKRGNQGENSGRDKKRAKNAIGAALASITNRFTCSSEGTPV